MIEQAGDNRGAQALLTFIRAADTSIPKFAEAHGLDRLKVQKAIHGGLQRVDVAFAFAVQEATEGAVRAEWWAEPAIECPAPTGTGGH